MLFIKKTFSSDKITIILFFLILLALSYHYNFHKIVTNRPMGIHSWRQTDCASQALNYYQNGMNFFKPELHCLISDNKTTGYCAEEFPIFFYFIAILYKIFGYHEFIYRLVNTLIFIGGLIALFKILKLLVSNNFWSGAIAIMFFTSPVLNYYANNFIGNTTAFSITIIGWYYFFKFYKHNKNKYFYYTIAFFTLSALLKISEAISLFTLLAIYFIELLNIYKYKSKEKLFKHKVKYIIPFILSFVFIFTWYLYAHYYNNVHDQQYYIFILRPIWTLPKELINNIWWAIKHRWFYDYFHVSILLLILTAFVINFIYIKKVNKLFLSITAIMFIGSVLFSLLWFHNLGDHDYYLISIYIFLVFVMITFIDLIKKVDFYTFSSLIIKLFFVVFLIFNFDYAKCRVLDRYKRVNTPGQVRYKNLYRITPYLRSLGISYTDKVISIPDVTPCLTLYIMNQRGWTEFLLENRDSILINENIKLGAKYLILSGEDMLTKDYLKPYIKNKIGEYGNVTIFKLPEHY